MIQMINSKYIVLILFFVLVPTLIVAAATFYFWGIKQYGTPEEYRKSQEAMLMAIQDSIRTEEGVISQENIGDSTMVGLQVHTDIFYDIQTYEKQINVVKAALDSIQTGKMILEEKEKEMAVQQSIFEDLQQRVQDEKITKLAKIYDSMKPAQATQLIITMDDTLAVLILTNMQQRTSAKLLVAVASENIEKAKNLNKLLAVLGTEIAK